MIIHTRIKDNKITIPDQLIEKYGITEDKLVILMDVGNGILIKPTSYKVPKEVIVKEKSSVENDIEAIISEIIKQQQEEKVKETIVK
ncbi:MAG: hypothetical protein N3F64_04980 [Nitrososphaeria archaeon]|nr:hypothetical protein [Nitrososphaeria archaeon]